MQEYRRVKGLNVHAIQLTPDNLEKVESLCEGSIKGTKLPKEQRVIEFYNKYLNSASEIEMGDFVVSSDLGCEVFQENIFNKIFEKVDPETLTEVEQREVLLEFLIEKLYAFVEVVEEHPLGQHIISADGFKAAMLLYNKAEVRSDIDQYVQMELKYEAQEK